MKPTALMKSDYLKRTGGESHCLGLVAADLLSLSLGQWLSLTAFENWSCATLSPWAKTAWRVSRRTGRQMLFVAFAAVLVEVPDQKLALRKEVYLHQWPQWW